MFYFYVLKISGVKDKKYYFGYTADLKNRVFQHQRNEVKTTKNKNAKLVYYEAYLNKYQAIKREKSIKISGSVRMALVKRLENQNI
ncbi:MAG: GIY-YIG nuclease family protein [Patescibacteria group bacterium]|jgi:putative endonuclease